MLRILLKYVYLVPGFIISTLFLQCGNGLANHPQESELPPITERMLEVSKCLCQYNLVEALQFFYDNPTATVDHLMNDTELIEMLPDALHEATTGAIELDDLEVIKALLARKVDFNVKNGIGFTPFHRAIYTNNNALFNLLLDQENINKNCRDNDGNTPLHLAALRGVTDMLETILSYYVDDVNIRNRDGSSGLHIAAAHNRVEFVKKLLTFPTIDINLQAKNGYTPLHANLTVNWSDSETLNLLLARKDAQLNIPDKCGNTPLHLAVLIGNSSAVAKLLQAGALVNVQNKKGNTPLHIAAGKGYWKITSLLRGQGVNYCIKNNLCKTPMDMAKQHILKLRHSYYLGLTKGPLGSIPMEKPGTESRTICSRLDNLTSETQLRSCKPNVRYAKRKARNDSNKDTGKTSDRPIKRAKLENEQAPNKASKKKSYPCNKQGAKQEAENSLGKASGKVFGQTRWIELGSGEKSGKIMEISFYNVVNISPSYNSQAANI